MPLQCSRKSIGWQLRGQIEQFLKALVEAVELVFAQLIGGLEIVGQRLERCRFSLGAYCRRIVVRCQSAALARTKRRHVAERTLRNARFRRLTQPW
jgi:hypothetical protein